VETCLYIDEGMVVCPVSVELVGHDRCRACPNLVRIEEPPGGPVVHCTPPIASEGPDPSDAKGFAEASRG
jgi:hypothetical protein